MKNLKATLGRALNIFAPLALALSIITANSMCFWFTYQPDEPIELQRYKIKRRTIGANHD